MLSIEEKIEYSDYSLNFKIPLEIPLHKINNIVACYFQFWFRLNNFEMKRIVLKLTFRPVQFLLQTLIAKINNYNLINNFSFFILSVSIL